MFCAGVCGAVKGCFAFMSVCLCVFEDERKNEDDHRHHHHHHHHK